MPKSSILIGFSIINQQFLGTSISGNLWEDDHKLWDGMGKSIFRENPHDCSLDVLMCFNRLV